MITSPNPFSFRSGKPEASPLSTGVWHQLRAAWTDLAARSVLGTLDRQAINDIGYHRVRAELDRRRGRAR